MYWFKVLFYFYFITSARRLFDYSLSHNTLQSRCNHQSLVSKRGFLLLSLGFLPTCHYQEVNFDLKLTSGTFVVFQSSKGGGGQVETEVSRGRRASRGGVLIGA